jgi:integrase
MPKSRAADWDNAWDKIRSTTTMALTVKMIDKLPPGLHSDGDGLYCRVKKDGRRYWSFIARDKSKLDKTHFERTGKVRYLPTEISLGRCDEVTLEVARAKAAEARALKREGKNPKAVRDEQRDHQASMPTFATVAEQLVSTKASGWRSEHYRNQVESALVADCKPFAGKRVSDVTTADVEQVLETVKARAPSRAQRVCRLIHKVLARAQKRGYVTGRNPANGLAEDYTPPPVVNHPAMDYPAVPAFVAQLRARRRDPTGKLRIDAYALEFVILCASRSGEVRNATWDQIDMAARTWTVPGALMKSGRDHTTALSDPAMEILHEVAKARRNDLVFPGFTIDQPLSDRVFDRLLERMGHGSVTTHGFRSAFRMWADNETEADPSLCEFALAHKLGSRTEEAYRRRPPLKKLGTLFAAWAAYLDGKPSSNVRPIRAA